MISKEMISIKCLPSDGGGLRSEELWMVRLHSSNSKPPRGKAFNKFRTGKVRIVLRYFDEYGYYA